MTCSKPGIVLSCKDTVVWEEGKIPALKECTRTVKGRKQIKTAVTEVVIKGSLPKFNISKLYMLLCSSQGGTVGKGCAYLLSWSRQNYN